MAEQRVYIYEAMFLLGQSAAADLTNAIDHIKEILSRAHAELISMKKWDERRLAYEIKKQKRGLYILAYFKSPAESLSHIERDCNLSETIIRSLILRCDHLTEEEMRAADATEALMAEARMRAGQTPRDVPTGPAVTVGAPNRAVEAEEAIPAAEEEPV